MCPGWVSHECIQTPREKYASLAPSIAFHRGEFWIQNMSNVFNPLLKAVAGHTSRMVVVVRLRFHVEYVGEISSVFMNANGAPAFLLWQ